MTIRTAALGTMFRLVALVGGTVVSVVGCLAKSNFSNDSPESSAEVSPEEFSGSAAELSVSETRGRMANALSCPLWIQDVPLSPIPECGFGWFNSWGPMSSAERNTLQAISATGGVVGIGLPCVEMTEEEFLLYNGQPNHPSLTRWPGAPTRNWHGTNVVTLDPAQACSQLWQWGRSTGRIPQDAAAVMLDSVDASFLGIPAGDVAVFREHVRQALDGFHQAGIVTVANISRYEDLAPIAGSLDIRGVEVGSLVVKGVESFDDAAAIVGVPMSTPNVMTAAMLTQADASPEPIRAALALSLILDIKTGGLAFTTNEGANTVLQPSDADPVLAELAALPIPTGPRYYNNNTHRWERALGASSLVWFDPSSRAGGWSTADTSPPQTPLMRTVRIRWTGVSAPWFYIRGAKVFGTSSHWCNGWDLLGTNPQSNALDLMVQIDDSAVTGLELQLYADTDQDDAAAIAYGSSSGTVEFWVDGVARAPLLGSWCQSPYDHFLLQL